ncbi:MAG: FMN-binding protein [Betaproteobacteria bacterium]|jgi:Na+-translocating ferredoxin:NAD+ oxidoreductase RnfG subunit
MVWKPSSLLAGISILGMTVSGQIVARTYVSTEEVKQIIFPGELLTHYPIKISKEIAVEMKKQSSVSHALDPDKIWKTAHGAWLVIDEVVGKHEMIKYALGINQRGQIVGLEIMEYNESYGYEVMEKKWRGQFLNKTSKDQIKLNHDIENITGATLSSKHVTDGVKRIMVLYQTTLVAVR